MVKAKTVDKKISASKKVFKRALKKQSAKNVSQDNEIAKLKVAMEKLKKRRPSSHVSEYNLFVRKQIKAGLTFSRAAKEWNKYKALQKKKGRKLSAYNQFIGSQMRLGKTFIQSVALWKLAKAGKLGKKGRTRTITKTVVRRVKSRPSTKTVIKRIKSAPRVITRTKFLPSPALNASQLRDALSGIMPSQISKSDLKEAMSPDDEEIAFKIIQTYFMEIARMGFKRRLSLDEIIDAYFHALVRVRTKGGAGKEVSEWVEDPALKN